MLCVSAPFCTYSTCLKWRVFRFRKGLGVSSASDCAQVPLIGYKFFL